MKDKAILRTIMMTVLMLTMLLYCFPYYAQAEVTIASDTFLERANASVGNSWSPSMCLAWVKTFWVGLGGPDSTSCCAHNYSLGRIQSTSRNNIPIGADVFLYKSSGSKCGTCGVVPGHIGVYVGNGNIVSTFTYNSGTSEAYGKIRLLSIDDWLSWGYTFAGWGWHDGIRVEENQYLTDPIIYNADYYRSHNSDLTTFNDEALLQHWLTCGVKEGRCASPVFYARYYVNAYSDLSAAFGTEYGTAMKHFITSGVSEGRTAHEGFTVNYYKANYKDLQEIYGDNNYGYCYHYITCGMNEGRIANKRLTIQLNVNGGSVDKTEITVTNFAKYGELPLPTRDGYDFVGWYTEKEDGNLVSADSTVDYHQVSTLYARWKKKLPEVIFLTVTPSDSLLSLREIDNKEDLGKR